MITKKAATMRRRKLSIRKMSFQLLAHFFFRVLNGAKSRVKSFAKAFASFTDEL